MFNVTIPISVLNIVVCTAIIVGCIYAMYRIIKKCKSTKKSAIQNNVYGKN